MENKKYLPPEYTKKIANLTLDANNMELEVMKLKSITKHAAIERSTKFAKLLLILITVIMTILNACSLIAVAPIFSMLLSLGVATILGIGLNVFVEYKNGFLIKKDYLANCKELLNKEYELTLIHTKQGILEKADDYNYMCDRSYKDITTEYVENYKGGIRKSIRDNENDKLIIKKAYENISNITKVLLYRAYDEKLSKTEIIVDELKCMIFLNIALFFIGGMQPSLLPLLLSFVVSTFLTGMHVVTNNSFAKTAKKILTSDFSAEQLSLLKDYAINNDKLKDDIVKNMETVIKKEKECLIFETLADSGLASIRTTLNKMAGKVSRGNSLSDSDLEELQKITNTLKIIDDNSYTKEKKEEAYLIIDSLSKMNEANSINPNQEIITDLSSDDEVYAYILKQ